MNKSLHDNSISISWKLAAITCLSSLFPWPTFAFVDPVAILNPSGTTITINVQQVTIPSCAGSLSCGEQGWGFDLWGWIRNDIDDGPPHLFCGGGKLPGESCGPTTVSLSWASGVLKNAATADIHLMLLFNGELVDSIDTRTVTINQKNLGDKNCKVGNPCNPADGNKYHMEEDLRIADKTSSFIRHYNSLLNVDFGFGKGWTASYQNIALKIGQSNILIQRSDGRGEPFWKNTSGLWQGDADSREGVRSFV